MGKAQKKRAMRRHNPMRVPDSHLPKGLASAASSSSKSEAILPIIQKMGSPDSAERKWACVAVSNLIQNDPSTRRLLQGKNIVGALIARLSDGEEEVVIEAAGALRNLCIDGGYEICAEMFNKNILVPLTTFVPKISSTLSQYLNSPKTAPENAQRLVYEFADNVVTILWCLSETSNKALNAINQINLIPFLMSFFASRMKLPISTVTAAAHCLYVLTDDNYPAINEVRRDAGYISCLLEIAHAKKGLPNGKGKEAADEKSIALQVLVSGILRNVSPLPSPGIASDIDIDKDIVMPLLKPVIASVSLTDATNKALELVDSSNSDATIKKTPQKDAPKSDHKTEYEADLERLESTLRTVQLALEILTGVCATLPDPGPEAAEEEGAEEDDDVMSGEDTNMDMQENPASSPSSSFLPILVQPLLALIHPTPLSFPPKMGPSPHPPMTSALSAIHVAAFECLNNIFLSLFTTANPAVTEDQNSGRKIWNEVWSALTAVGTESGPGQERRHEIWELATGVLWGIGNVWKGSLIPDDEQVKTLIQLCDLSSDPKIRVKCIGTLECLAQHPESVQANATISNYLLSVVDSILGPSPAGTEPLIQSVSALIDIYSDETLPYDINFRQGKYLDRLIANVENVKKAVRAIDRRKEGGNDLRRRGNEVRENLVDFIQYRRDLRI